MPIPYLKRFALAAAFAVATLANPFAFAATDAADSGATNTVRATLANGLRVVIVRDTLAPVVSTQLTYLAGGYETPPGFPGTAHALEHMMFRGSQGLTGAQLNEMTGKLGGDNNAFTTSDATQFTFAAPAAYLDILLRVEASRMRGALLDQKKWDSEKGAIEQEVSRDISDPGFLAYEQAERILFAGTGYAEDPLGSRPTFDRTTSKTLRAFYDAWYQPGNAIYVIVGDVDPQATLAQIKTLFASIPSRPTPKRRPIVLKPVKAKTIALTTPSATGSVQFLYRMPGMQSRDYAAADVLMDVLNNPRSDLSELAAQGKVLSADAQAQPFTRGSIGIVEVGFAKDGKPDEARAHLERVVRKLVKDGVPPELVEAAKRSEAAQFEFAKNSATSLASAWSQALAWQGLDSPQAAEDQIQAVTVADVNRVARQWLKPDARVTIVLTPNANGKKPPNSTGFGGSESFGGDEKLTVPLPDWAAKTLGTLQMPHWTLDPVRTKLPNGITLIVQPESISKTVTVVGHIDSDEGMQEPPGKEGIARLLSSLFDYGTTTLDRAAFHKKLDAIAASESGGSDFALAVPSAGFDAGMALLADNELNPALPQAAFAIQRESLAQLLAGELQSPRYKTVHALRKGLLPAGDPHLREATPTTVSGISLDDVKGFFTSAYRPDLTTIVMVGDITPEQARAAVEKYFGAWKAVGPKPNVIPPKVPLNPPGYAVVPNPYASQDTVLMGQVVDVDLHDPVRYALELGNDILGGNGFASRLMQDIRVGHGYAYGAASGLRIDRTRSIFYVQYGSDPDKVAAVDDLVRTDIGAMQKAPVTADELTNARQFEIRSIPLEVSSVSRIASALLTWSYHDEPLDQPMVAARHYLELTAAQVQDAFTKHVQPAHFVQVVEGPAPPKH